MRTARLLALAASILGVLTRFGSLAQAGEVTLEDQSLLIAFDSRSGALTRFEDKAAHWTIERRPGLADAFRLFAPLPERRWNPVSVGNHEPDDAALFRLPPGQKQPAATVRKISNHLIHFQWQNPVAEMGGVVPLTLRSDVTLTNGVLTFSATLENNSALTIETIDYPYFGDLNPPSRAASNMVVRFMPNGNADSLVAEEIYPHFINKKGYWGVFWPTKILEPNGKSFCLVQSKEDGLFAGANSTPPAYRVQYVFEQHPGLVSSVTSLVPPQDEINGQPVHLEFRLCHFLFQKPHSTITLMPVVLRFYHGDEPAGIAP